ncbi:hypothetical protein SB766_13245 [Pseudomonas sp. SIMBA_077]
MKRDWHPASPAAGGRIGVVLLVERCGPRRQAMSLVLEVADGSAESQATAK